MLARENAGEDSTIAIPIMDAFFATLRAMGPTYERKWNQGSHTVDHLWYCGMTQREAETALDTALYNGGR